MGHHQQGEHSETKIKKYDNGVYSVYYHPNARGRRKLRVVHKRTGKHTHRYNEKEARDLANFAKHGNIPRDAKVDYLVSLERLLICERKGEECRACTRTPVCAKFKTAQLIETKRDKRRGNRNYYNKPPNVRR